MKRYWPSIVFIFGALGLFFVRIYHIDGQFSVALGNPKDSLIVIRSVEVLRRNISFFRGPDYAEPYEKIGWVTDIHADRFKRRGIDSGTIFPRQYAEYLSKVFDALRLRGIDTVIVTGDNANSGDKNYGRGLAKIAAEKHMHVLWVMGNHDSDRSMAALGVVGSKDYFFDYGDTRIIVLDDAKATRETGDYEGGIDQGQLDWLRAALKTDERVIIAMHIPIFREQIPWMNAVQEEAKRNNTDPDRVTPFALPEDTIVVPHFTPLEGLLRQSGNVKMVVTGHFHLPWQKDYDGIRYYGEAALTHERFKGSYGVIDVKKNTVEYLKVR